MYRGTNMGEKMHQNKIKWSGTQHSMLSWKHSHANITADGMSWPVGLVQGHSPINKMH